MSAEGNRNKAAEAEERVQTSIDMRAFDPRFRFEVAAEPGAGELQRCFACGVCTGSCPVSEIEPRFSPSRIMRMVLLGMRDEVLGGDEIWYCAQCFSCSFHCPQEVHFADVIKALRHLARRDGHVTEAFAAAVDEVGRITQSLRLRLVERLAADKAADELPEPRAVLRQLIREEEEEA
jgi:heterodisulfide reductase subunit C